MSGTLPPVDIAAAGESRDNQMKQLAGRLVRDALAGAADQNDAAISLAIALIVAIGGAHYDPALTGYALEIAARTVGRPAVVPDPD